MKYKKVLEFIQQLVAAGMERKDITPRAYNFALALLQSEEEMKTQVGRELSATIRSQCMDIAADLLKDAMAAFDVQAGASEAEPMLPAGMWEELASVQRNDIYAMKDRMVRHLNAEVEAFYREHPELKIDYRFQVEALRK